MSFMTSSFADRALIERALSGGGNGRGRKPVSVLDQIRMQRLRMRGNTLQTISDVMGFSMMTVFKYTASIPCTRRHNKHVLVHRRTGLAA